MKTEYYYWFFFVDSHVILSTHRVHGTSAAWCFCGSIVQWYTGTGVALPYPNPLKLLCCRCFLNFRRVHDLAFPCYWCEMLQDMGYPPRFWKTCCFFRFRYSFRHTSYLSPFPFSATAQIIENHTRYYHAYLMKQLYFVCKRCWTYSRHVNTLHEPCWGCHILESTGWEFWTPGRGRSAWWRHPCWMFSLHFISIRFPLDYTRCHDFPKLAHPS